MKKQAFLLSFFSFFNIILYSQSFVNNLNSWYLTDCCFSAGEFYCGTYYYYFGSVIQIDTMDYYPLISNAENSLFIYGEELYREESGQVFMKQDATTDEVLIYDFNLTVGEQIIVGNVNDSPQPLEVLTIDSVTLNSGEIRKRIELGVVDELNLRTYWIEGIGSDRSSLNPAYNFYLDCWNNFNCYKIDDIIEYSLGDCMLTKTEDIQTINSFFIIQPNPVQDRFFINVKNDRKIEQVEILDFKGNIVLTEGHQKEINISKLSSGIYIVKVYFKDGFLGVSKLIKS